MVDNFQKQYEAIKIPFPADNVTPQVEQQRAQVVKEIEEFKNASSGRIAAFEKEISHLNSLLPYAQMTMEDFADAFPDQAIDQNKPTFWPHDAAEQEPRVEPEEHH
jgi:F-type H+-transporting ATPase subunit d